MQHGSEILLGIAIFTFQVGAWQLDLICAPLVWGQPNYIREVLPWIFMPNQTFYVLNFGAMDLGLVLTYISTWRWQEKRTKKRRRKFIKVENQSVLIKEN